MSLSTPISVQKLQTALHAKAKGSPDLRFYTVYDKMNRTDVLAFAYDCCRANRGAAGVDDQAFDDIEAYGRERWLGELTEAYRTVHQHVRHRLRQWLCAKHQMQGQGSERFTDRYLHDVLGLVCLPKRTANFPWAKA